MKFRNPFHPGFRGFPDEYFNAINLCAEGKFIVVLKQEDGEWKKREKLGHLIAAFIILVHAMEKFDDGGSSYILFIVAGIVFLLVALLHHRIAKIFPYVDGVFYIIEAILYALIAADYFHKGKKALPWCYIATTIGYVFIAFVKGKKKRHIV